MVNKNLIESIKYYNKKFDESARFKVPANPYLHHYISICISAILETQINTYFIIPILLFILTFSLMIGHEFKIRVVQYCIAFESDDIEKWTEDKIFYSSKDLVESEGMIYFKTKLVLKSFIFFVLMYYATIGFLT